jgi:hypothetical protein
MKYLFGCEKDMLIEKGMGIIGSEERCSHFLRVLYYQC